MNLEFVISQYVDGTLSEAERIQLEALLANDAAARALVEQHRKLNEALRATPMPAVRWELLAERIGNAVAEAEAPAASYRLFARRFVMPLAMAASLLIACGVAITIYLAGHRQGNISPLAMAHRVVQVYGPVAESAPNAVEEISIGPARESGGQAAIARYSDELVSHTPRLVIASAVGVPASYDSSAPY
jgi:anti-sigma factor RsiW